MFNWLGIMVSLTSWNNTLYIEVQMEYVMFLLLCVKKLDFSKRMNLW